MIDTQKVRRLLDTPVGVGDGLIRDLCDEIDRLRAPKPQPQGKTVRVRVKAAVDCGGSAAVGEDNFKYLLEPRAYYTITADLPVPEETTVEAEVHTATTDENANSGGRG